MGSETETQMEQPMPAPAPAAPMPESKIPFIALIGGILMIVGIFLPWASVSYANVSVSVNGMNLFGYMVLLMGVLVVVGAVIKKPKLSAIFGIIGLVLSLIPLALLGLITSTYETAAQLAGAADYSAGMGIGIILCFVGSIVAMVGGFMKK